MLWSSSFADTPSPNTSSPIFLSKMFIVNKKYRRDDDMGKHGKKVLIGTTGKER
jgi:hypothetical protein